MGPVLLLAVYLLPAAFALLIMIRARSFSFRQISRLRRPQRKVTLGGWLAVYGHLGMHLENQKEPPNTKPEKPWRLIGSGAAFATSLILFFLILPMNIPLSYAQHDWNAITQAAVAGAVLASSVVLAFRRPRNWRLIGHPEAEYPYAEWKALGSAPAKEEGKMA